MFQYKIWNNVITVASILDTCIPFRIYPNIHWKVSFESTGKSQVTAFWVSEKLYHQNAWSYFGLNSKCINFAPLSRLDHFPKYTCLFGQNEMQAVTVFLPIERPYSQHVQKLYKRRKHQTNSEILLKLFAKACFEYALTILVIGSVGEVSTRFRRGFGEVSARFRHGLGKMPARFWKVVAPRSWNPCNLTVKHHVWVLLSQGIRTEHGRRWFPTAVSDGFLSSRTWFRIH